MELKMTVIPSLKAVFRCGGLLLTEPVGIPDDLLIPSDEPVGQEVADDGNSRQPETQPELAALKLFCQLVGKKEGG